MIQDLISIVVPTYNGEKYIEECLESIEQQNIQCEVIVVDDQSTDRTVEIAKEYGAHVIVKPTRSGQVASKNLGIKSMNGEYFVTIDQDDCFRESALEGLLEEIKRTDSAIVLSKLEDFPETEGDRKFCHAEAFRGILTGAAIFKREIFDIIGLFDESVITGEVIDLVDRCNKNNVSIYKSGIITCRRRIHQNNYGRTNQQDEYKDYAKLLRKQFLERLNKQ